MKIRQCTFVLCLLLVACDEQQQRPAPAPVRTPAPARQAASVEAPVDLPPPGVPAVAKPDIPVINRQKPAVLPVLPSPPVDLSLPQELLEDLQLGEPIPPDQPQDLLPPLFVEKPEPKRNLQLNGRLLLNDDVKDDYKKSVDGAELQLEFKR